MTTNRNRLHREKCSTFQEFTLALVMHNGYIYHYVYKRVNGTVLRLYSASGDEAQNLQAIDDDERRELAETRRVQTEIDDHHRHSGRIERRRRRSAKVLVSMVLESSGFVRYQRGNLKRRTMRALPVPVPKASAKLEARKLAAELIEDELIAVEIRGLVKRLLHGNDAVLPRLQEISRLHPGVFGAELFVDLPAIALHALAKLVGNNNPKFSDGLVVAVRLQAYSLAGDDASPVKRKCAMWVAICEAQASALTAICGGSANTSREQSRRLAAASREYTRSLKTLAEITRLETRRPRRVQPEAIDATFKIVGRQ
jgi:hypothetical protein